MPLTELLVLALVSTAPAAGSPVHSSPLALVAHQVPTQPTAAPRGEPAPLASSYPLGVQLMTAIEHPFMFAGQLIEIPPSPVKRVIGPRLIALGERPTRGVRRSYQLEHWDKLLVVLPAQTGLAKGDYVVVTGTMRTIAGVQAAGGLPDLDEKTLRSIRNRPVVVAESVRTADGVDLLRPR